MDASAPKMPPPPRSPSPVPSHHASSPPSNSTGSTYDPETPHINPSISDRWWLNAAPSPSSSAGAVHSGMSLASDFSAPSPAEAAHLKKLDELDLRIKTLLSDGRAVRLRGAVLEYRNLAWAFAQNAGKGETLRQQDTEAMRRFLGLHRGVVRVWNEMARVDWEELEDDGRERGDVAGSGRNGKERRGRRDDKESEIDEKMRAPVKDGKRRGWKEDDSDEEIVVSVPPLEADDVFVRKGKLAGKKGDSVLVLLRRDGPLAGDDDGGDGDEDGVVLDWDMPIATGDESPIPPKKRMKLN
ncbi:hypothetical protein N0V90_007561 [Kalmusia sp. IMI 367209]|nr:hypothetical protein N0V90_007561 [Kalmusia sp. IMI 367209]